MVSNLDGDGGHKSIIERNLCCMTIRHGVFFIEKADMDHQRTRIVEDARELEDFENYWRNEIIDEEECKRSAIQIFIRERFGHIIDSNPWNIRHEVKLEKMNDEFINQESTMKVTSKGPIYGYLYLAEIVVPFQ